MCSMARLEIDNPLLSAMKTEEPETKTTKKGRPRKPGLVRTEEAGTTIQNGLPPELRRFTAICKTANWKKLKAYAFTQRITTREALDEIIEVFFEKYEKNPKNPELLDPEEYRRQRRAR